MKIQGGHLRKLGKLLLHVPVSLLLPLAIGNNFALAGCNFYGCSQSSVAECNFYGCPNPPRGAECNFYGCPPSPQEPITTSLSLCTQIENVRALAERESLETSSLVRLARIYCARGNPTREGSTRNFQRNSYFVLRADHSLNEYELPANSDYIRVVESNVSILRGVNSRVDYIRNLPPGLQVLNLAGTQVDYIRNLPLGLQVLNLAGTQVDYIRNLPLGLRVLDIRDTSIDYLRNLPNSLECIITGSNNSGVKIYSDPRSCPSLPIEILIP